METEEIKMARLTYKTKDGSWGLRGVPWTQLVALPPRVYGALAKLKDMEEVGMVRQTWQWRICWATGKRGQKREGSWEQNGS